MDNYNTVKLPLTNAPGKYALVDDDYDGEWLSGFRWRLTPTGYVYKSRHSGNNNVKYLSRMAFGESLIPENTWVSYRNGDRLDCRTRNLVLITPATSLRGVREYGSNIYAIAGRSYLTGPNGGILRFPSVEAAAHAYDLKAHELWGDRAVLNFPDELDLSRTTLSYGTEAPRRKERTMKKTPSIAEQVAARTGQPIGSKENFDYLLGLAAHSAPKATVPKVTKPSSSKVTANDRRELQGLVEALAAYVAAAFGGSLADLDPVDQAEIKRVQEAIEGWATRKRG